MATRIDEGIEQIERSLVRMDKVVDDEEAQFEIRVGQALLIKSVWQVQRCRAKIIQHAVSLQVPADMGEAMFT